MKFGALLFCSGVLLAFAHTASAQALHPERLKGTQRCGAVIYSWPTSTNTAPAEVAQSTLEVDGDGEGHWTRGSVRFDRGTGAEKKPCELTLAKGSYKIRTDGSGTSTVTWTSKDPECTKVIAQYGAGSFKPSESATSVVRIFPDLQNRNLAHQMTYGPAGFTVGTCELGTH